MTGPTADADLALGSAAAEWRVASGISVIAKVDGELGDTSRTLASAGTLRVTW